MSTYRVLVTSKVTITKTFYTDGVLADPDGAGAVTVTAKKLDGTQMQQGPATKVSTGVYTFLLNASAVLDHWTLEWSGTFAGAIVVQRDFVEHVGGFLFGLAEAVSYNRFSPTKYTAAELADVRLEVEQECELICRRAFVPRYARYTLPSRGTSFLTTPDSELRTLRSVSVLDVAWDTDAVEDVSLRSSGELYLPFDTWPAEDITVEYEHGWDYPPERIRTAAMKRLKTLLEAPRSGVPSNAASYTTQDGSTYRLSNPGPRRTGFADIDGAYQAYSRGRRAVFA